MLHDGKSHVGIRNYAPDGGKWDGKQVVICPLSMRQKIHDAMGEHANKERLCRFVEYSGQGEQGTHNDKGMHGNCYSMQHRVVQERMEFRSYGRMRQVFQRVRHKAQG